MTTYLRDFVQSESLNHCVISTFSTRSKTRTLQALSRRRILDQSPPPRPRADVSDVPAELRRHFEGLRELDCKVVELQRQVDEDCLAQLTAAAERQAAAAAGPASKRQRVDPAAEAEDAELTRRIEHTMNEIIRLSEEKMNRAQQTYDYIDQHIRKLDKDLRSFDADVAKERQKLGLPPAGALGAVAEGSAGAGGASGGKGGQRKRGGAGAAAAAAPAAPAPALTSEELYQQALAVADAMEPTYCYCKRISFGEMIACEHPECPIEWFHFECVGLTTENRLKGELVASRVSGFMH